MSIESFLNSLDKLHEVSPGRYRARCPAHGSKSQTLAISLTNDGMLLLHCFAGCSALEVVQATGHSLSDLYDKPLTHEPVKRKRGAISAAQALACIEHEVIALLMCKEQDEPRAIQARVRIFEALAEGGR
ncbi:MAG: hypothetical protein KGL39_40045 [Patescibacteria group bacterium]|nr:hypothetical protein [Patescibacteria group bacterium]